MNVSRETVYAALLAKLGAAAGFVTVSRRLRHWSDVPGIEQPALFQVQKTEAPTQQRGFPAVWTLKVDAVLYCQAPDDATPASTVLNPILDAIEAALAPDPATGFQSLGGLVSHCWISGPVETDEGTLGEQTYALVPIEIKL